MCSSYRSNQNPQTVKLSPRSSPKLLGRYATDLTPMRPNRPHIPSFINFSKSAATKIDKVTSFLAHPRQPYLQVLRSVTVACAAASFRHRHVSASVRRYLRREPRTRKADVWGWVNFRRSLMGHFYALVFKWFGFRMYEPDCRRKSVFGLRRRSSPVNRLLHFGEAKPDSCS